MSTSAAAIARGTWIVGGIAAVLLLPRIALSWFAFPGDNPVPVIATFAFVIGIITLGRVLYVRLLARLRSRTRIGLIGLAALVAGALATSAVTAAAQHAVVAAGDGALVPPGVALLNWAFLAALAVWLLGLVLVLAAAVGGALALALRRRR